MTQQTHWRHLSFLTEKRKNHKKAPHIRTENSLRLNSVELPRSTMTKTLLNKTLALTSRGFKRRRSSGSACVRFWTRTSEKWTSMWAEEPRLYSAIRLCSTTKSQHSISNELETRWWNFFFRETLTNPRSPRSLKRCVMLKADKKSCKYSHTLFLKGV